MDFLDHVIPRLYLPPAVDLTKLRSMTETVICYAAHDYHFTYRPPSMVAAASIMFSLQNCVARSVKERLYSDRELAAVEKITRDARTCLQILTHVSGTDLDTCCAQLTTAVPDQVTGATHDSTEHVSPDSTVNHDIVPEPDDELLTSTPSRSSSSSSYYSATDLFSEAPSSTSAHPLQSQPFITSAVDVFTDFNSSALESTLSQPDPYSSILLSL